MFSVFQEALARLDSVTGIKDLYYTVREVLNDLLLRKVSMFISIDLATYVLIDVLVYN
jgi:hypothetical protein